MLPPLADELLSSWIGRHASFYGVSGGRLLRHYALEAASLRELDLKLTSHDQRRLAHLLRYDPYVIRNMMQSRGWSHPAGLIATIRTIQVCRRCSIRHWAASATCGARLRSWMEGWRLACPVCGTPMVDARPFDLLARPDPANPLLVGVAEPARQGEQIMTRAVHLGRRGHPLLVLMRNLLLPRTSPMRGGPFADEIPRLLDVVLPGFDRFLYRFYPSFKRPSTLLLPLSIRIPVLAGVACVASQPDHWADRLLSAVSEIARPRFAECLESLMAGGVWRRGLSAICSQGALGQGGSSHLLTHN
jgi:hypothetical protein